MKLPFLSLLSVLFVLIVGATSDTKVDENCDPILSSMVNRCTGVRNSLLNSIDLDSKVVCCLNFRYNMCVLSVAHYSYLGKITPFCPNKVYELKISQLKSYKGKDVVETVCTGFESHTCITEPLSNVWNTMGTIVQSGIEDIRLNWDNWIRVVKEKFGVNRRDQIEQKSNPL